jgi:3-hydroxyisobutyrate dehydrogenase
MKIGWIGTGRMGAAMVERLIEGGFNVSVWNRSSEKLNGLIGKGATAMPSAGTLAKHADIIISILTNDAAIDACYRGVGGVLSAGALALRGKIIIEMSTVQPQVAQALARDIEQLGASMLDCPVGGTVGPAREGKLFGLVGGAREDLERVLPILNHLCRRVEWVGPQGAGASMKLCVNMPLMIYWQTLGEALSLVRHLPISPEKIIDIMSDTSGTPTAMKGRAPAIIRMMKGEPGPPAAFDMAMICKDLHCMLAEADLLNKEVPVLKAALMAYESSIQEADLGSLDGTALPAYWSSRRRTH